MSGSLPSEVKPFFPYDTPRDAQVQGVPQVQQTARINGFFLLEGACGSGKTILALSPLIEKVRREDTDYERVLVITSVKQQLRAFEEAVKDINGALDSDTDPVTALTMTGKADVDPYVRQGVVDARDVYDVSEDLREATRELVNQAGDELTDKRDFARQLYQEAEVNDEEYPYQQSIPTYETGAGEEEVQYSPYYARHLTGVYSREMEHPGRNAEYVVPFDQEDAGVLTPDRLVEQTAVQAGTEPHSVMGDLLEEVEVVVGNYYHVFDQQTVDQFTEAIVSDETLLVVDEAHNLVPRVRDLLGTESSFEGLSKAIQELDEVIGWVSGNETQTQDARETTQGLFDGAQSIGVDDMRQTKALLEDIQDRIGRHVEGFLDDELGPSWEQNPSRHEEMEMPLRDPQQVKPDKLSQWLSLSSYGTETLKEARRVADLAHLIRSEVYEKHYGYTRLTDTSIRGIGELLHDWVSNDHASFFRQVRLSPATYDRNEVSHDWQEHFRATLAIENCIPSDAIAERLDGFGAGVLMSATLTPFDVFRQVTGINTLEEDKERPIIQRRYSLPFPDENRISLTGDAPSYRYNNRGSPTDSHGNPNLDNPTRETYADAILDVVETTPGNVLVSMPSYSEAEWAGRIIEREGSVSVENVLIDESSTNKVTEELKQKFFSGGKKVLITGAHGTLIEGVDYKDEKLQGVIVCGVPLQSTQKPYQKAIRAAYEDRFGRRNGFEYAFSLPAVYKTRQSLGRVIRTHDDTGVRVMLDERYAANDDFGNVRQFFPDEECDEYLALNPDALGDRLEMFWKERE